MALEGVPIQPNLAVAGTTGGPVSALNINLLKRSNFTWCFSRRIWRCYLVFLMSIFEVGILIPQKLLHKPCHGRFGIGNGGTTKKG